MEIPFSDFQQSVYNFENFKVFMNVINHIKNYGEKSGGFAGWSVYVRHRQGNMSSGEKRWSKMIVKDTKDRETEKKEKGEVKKY